MSLPVATFLQDPNFIYACYIVAFSLFIYGLSGLTGPRTAVRGNRIAATGMAIAVIATLLSKHMHNWGLIVAGLVIGSADGTFNKVILFIAIVFGTINIVGGFLVTDRMLGMFKGRKPDPEEPDES